ncbi:MAG: DUF1987 domain-containing protein [Sporomusaceae bacterium]|jgi:hypothetical protein|nr:DUF1987 domain-containing protein [Sporomusaceae bacterium]
MAFRLEIEKTESLPYVLVDEEKEYLKLAGICYHERAIDFFEQICTWLENFLKTDFNEFTFDFAMEYFNSSTAKLVFNMLLALDNSAKEGKKIVINWMTTKDNEVIIEFGEDFQEELSNVEFNLIIR